MRELGKLTVDQANEVDRPVSAGHSNGKPVAWLVPLTAAERRRLELFEVNEPP